MISRPNLQDVIKQQIANLQLQLQQISKKRNRSEPSEPQQRKRIRFVEETVNTNVSSTRNQNINKKTIFKNEELSANAVVSALNEVPFVLGIGRTQSGKTTTEVLSSYLWLKQKYGNKWSDYVLFIGCFSDKSLKVAANQKIQQLRDTLGNSVPFYHLNDLHLNGKRTRNSEVDVILNRIVRSGGLLVFDECHLASASRQTIDNMRSVYRLDKPDELLSQGIRMLFISATPGNIKRDMEHIGSKYCRMVEFLVGEGYEGIEALSADSDRLRESRHLGRDLEGVKEFASCIKQRWGHQFYAYHFVRLPKFNSKHEISSENDLQDYIAECLQNEGFDIEREVEIRYHSQSKGMRPILEELMVEPNKHVIYLIKQTFRCGQEMVKNYLGVLYESASESCVETVIQGLLGRATGYTQNIKRKPNFPSHVVFTVKKYVRDMISAYQNAHVFIEEYRGRQVKTLKNGISKSKPSHLHYTNQTLDFSTKMRAKSHETRLTLSFKEYSREQRKRDATICYVVTQPVPNRTSQPVPNRTSQPVPNRTSQPVPNRTTKYTTQQSTWILMLDQQFVTKQVAKIDQTNIEKLHWPYYFIKLKPFIGDDGCISKTSWEKLLKILVQEYPEFESSYFRNPLNNNDGPRDPKSYTSSSSRHTRSITFFDVLNGSIREPSGKSNRKDVIYLDNTFNEPLLCISNQKRNT